MSSEEPAEYYLLWKGRQTGPFSLAAIREKLASGEINRMQQVGSNGRWTVLGEFLEQQDRGSVEARRAEEAQRQAEAAQRQAEAAQREEQLRSDYEAQLAAERAQQSALQERLADAEKRASFGPPPPGYGPAPGYAPDYASTPGYAGPGYTPPGYGDPYAASYPPPATTRTSGLAVAAFVLSLCDFIPYAGIITCVLAIIFGHIALSQIKRDPTLAGRGLALAGLIITYVLLALGVIAGLVYGLIFAHAIHL